MDKIVNIKETRKLFQDEQDELLYAMLDSRYFYPWRISDYSTPIDQMPKGSLELYITADCNQKCEYCYLQKYDELYPGDKSPETIKKNLRILLDWVVENRFYLPNIDLFSGEIWHTHFGLEILDIIYEYVHDQGMPLPSITIPTNGTFLHFPSQTIEMQNRIDKFKDVNAEIKISFSVDGKLIEDLERPLVGTNLVRDDAFYEKLFQFAKHNHYGFHPMLAAKSAKYWIDNFKWWISMLNKYHMPMDSIMLLEVRNDDWESEDNEAYRNFIQYLVDFTYEYHDGDFNQFVDDILLVNQLYERNSKDLLWGESTAYMPHSFGDSSKGLYGCTIQTHLTVRLGDLAIAPCHRSAYDKYLFGHFVVNEETNKITHIKANNPQIAITLLMLDMRYSVPGCDSCKFNPVCLGTCKGQSIESQKDPFHNDPKVCNFLRSKYTILFQILEEKGVMTWLKENMTKYHGQYETFKTLIGIWEAIKEEEENERLAKLRQNLYR